MSYPLPGQTCSGIRDRGATHRRFLFQHGGGEVDGEGGSGSEGAFNADRAAVFFHAVAHNGKPESGPTHFARTALVDSVKPFENPR